MKFNLVTTGIGSVPFLDIKETCKLIIDSFKKIPFWPQLVKRTIYEDMIIQFSEGIPFLKVDKEKRAIFAIKGDSPEKELLKFYERFLEEDISYFSISKDYAPGLYLMIDLVKKSDATFIKGQTVGPITFSASIRDQDGRSILSDNEIMDVCTKGIAIKGVWQVRKLKESGKNVILFLDEPYLASIGSAFSLISKEKVVNILKEVIGYIKQREDVLIGIHCCANTDWSMIFDSRPDIISFDAFGYMENFLLYRDKILRFIKDGGAIAWGIVPTTDADFEQKGNINKILKRLKIGFERLEEWGINREMLIRSSILTPSCGMGTMKEENAKKAIQLLEEIPIKIWEG